MIIGIPFAGNYAPYSTPDQEQSPHILRLKQPLFAAPVLSIFTESSLTRRFSAFVEKALLAEITHEAADI
ncbi:MAG: hypothetical protein QM278_06125 [Pseudomonadota bacterium]|nr:hypothetical protein [Pseudomonadota bacterium]